MEDIRPKIDIALTENLSEDEAYFSDIFKDFNTSFYPIKRKADVSNLKDIYLFLGETIVTNLVWEMLKFSFRKVFHRDRDIHIILRDKNGTQFSINHRGDVRPVVTEEKLKEFEKVKDFYSLGRYLIVETEDVKKEKVRRVDFFIGAIFAIASSFVTNILSNIYYDKYVNPSNQNSISVNQVIYFSSLLIFLLIFLNFFIQDYKYCLHPNKDLLRRFAFYLDNDSTVVRWSKLISLTITGVIILVPILLILLNQIVILLNNV